MHDAPFSFEHMRTTGQPPEARHDVGDQHSTFSYGNHGLVAYCAREMLAMAVVLEHLGEVPDGSGLASRAPDVTVG
ncbi:hypothetical protein [Sphingomonas mucosissima]|uniref:Uncharacterized protein n=1 Tax=Sphingomonas mucosissima TaxID=370959 RepID=A0A245ZDH4_9SPHN|nr:hypothetical protein [Sphingomonas mucosissima]OWK27722.1 hypothetical protein SPMU_33640 [Sphingomonas mucosissima]